MADPLEQEAVELLQRLIRFDTVNPPGAERAAQELLAGLLRDAGFEVTLVGRTQERPNLIARLGGVWEGHELWGRRKLAYEIDHKADGIYHFITLEAEPATLDELSRILKITDGVMRHLAVRRVEGSRPGPPPPAPAVPEPQYAGNTRSQEEE